MFVSTSAASTVADVKSWLIQHQLMVGGVILAFLLLAALNYIWVMLLVRRRGKQLERNSVVLHQA